MYISANKKKREGENGNDKARVNKNTYGLS